MIGTKLAHYEITSHLGSGGMGDVYEATDSKLRRSVAIKFLPEAFSHDSERVARFEREARVLASMNHSNIAAIFGLEESGERKFLVMELVGGETLAERIKRGPIPVDESLGIAKQICEALEAAHEKGIIHRDLKPANIKLTPEGKVKVLDFGLAKAFEGDAKDVSPSNSPTLSQAATNAGMILGTAAYMSPEQAKGANLDRRTDIFSFGAVLYEMLTGRQAFQGDTVAEILARVVEREPDWNRLPKNTPSVVRRLLERCLRKDRNRRLQIASDARIEIEEALINPGLTDPAAPSPASRRRERLAWTMVVLALLAAVSFEALYFRAPSADMPETRTDIITPATYDPASFTISPDGRRLVFVASGDGAQRLWLRSLDGTTAQPLAGTEGATLPFWSPDSKSVGFFVGSALKRIDVGGGLPQKLADATSNGPRGGAWSSDGVILFAPSTSVPLSRIPASGGQAAAATKLDTPSQTSHQFPQFLPGGRQFLFYVTGTVDAAGIYLGSLDSPETKRLTAADTFGLYIRSGWLLFIRQGTLVARRFDPVRGELGGDPVTVADSASQGAFSVSETGVIAYRSGIGARRQFTWFDRTGKMLGTLGAPDDNGLADPRISSNGRQVAVDRTVQGNADIWLMDETRMTRFTFDASIDNRPMWSPDGKQIAFNSTRKKGLQDLYVKPSSGAGSEELLRESPVNNTASDWSPDGRFILFATNGNHDEMFLPVHGDHKPQLFYHTNFLAQGFRFSPDGRWVSYQSTESGQIEIYVRPFPGPGGQWQISTNGGISAQWRRDGKELYYIAPDGKLMTAPIAVQGDTLVPGAPVALFQTRILGGGTNPGRSQYDVAADGRFLINQMVDSASASPITLLQNWKPPAK